MHASMHWHTCMYTCIRIRIHTHTHASCPHAEICSEHTACGKGSTHNVDALFSIRHSVIRNASQAEVADLEVTVRVHTNVAGFEVAMNHLGGVNEFEASDNLIHEELDMVAAELLA
jgi:hypothetical protein